MNTKFIAGLQRTVSEVLVDRGRMYALFSDGPGGLFLEVVCGGIAMYAVTVILSSEEAEAFEREGKPFLDSLAYRIASGLDDRTKRHCVVSLATERQFSRRSSSLLSRPSGKITPRTGSRST